MVRATGSYPVGHKFESHRRYHQKTTRKRVYIYGPLVKRLRHHPFTVVTWVRVPYGSPAKSTPFSVCFFAVARTTWGEPTVRKMHSIFFAEGFPFMGNGKPPYGSFLLYVPRTGRSKNPSGSRVQLAIWRSQGATELRRHSPRGPLGGIGDSRTGHLFYFLVIFCLFL